jgi:flagellar assembly factor FliW
MYISPKAFIEKILPVLLAEQMALSFILIHPFVLHYIEYKPSVTVKTAVQYLSPSADIKC